jgi:hypothetical protein
MGQHAAQDPLVGAAAWLPIEDGLEIILSVNRRLRRQRVVGFVLGIFALGVGLRTGR